MSLAVVSCGRGGKSHSNDNSNPASTSTNDNETRLKELLRTRSDKITIEVNPDGYLEAKALAAMKGEDRQSYDAPHRIQVPGNGACRSVNFLSPTYDRPDVIARILSLGASTRDYTGFSSEGFRSWMTHAGIVTFPVYAIDYPNFLNRQSWPNWSPKVTYVCPVLNVEKLKGHIVPTSSDMHSGGSLIVGRRHLTKWTYTNAYETSIPGMGNVKVLAGTFTYTIKAELPHVTFGDRGAGRGSIKAHLDPDNGQWIIETLKLGDPTMTLD
jgi:hypothetical protein